ncbi:MAG: hypothetical protein ACR2QO_08025, partial [Acidimicrobiales bacterium]
MSNNTTDQTITSTGAPSSSTTDSSTTGPPAAGSSAIAPPATASPAVADRAPSSDVAEALASLDRASARRRWPFMVFGIAVGAAATWAFITYLDRQQTDTGTDSEAVELTTAPVERRDLLEEIEWSGTLGY